MNKNFWLLIILLSTVFLGFTSCEESDGIDEFANWKERNDEYIDSIANVVANNPSEWKRYKGWTLPPDAMGSVGGGNVQDYIYVRSITKGESNEVIFTSDTLKLNYRGKRVDGFVFDGNYNRPEFDPDFVTPQKVISSGKVLSVGDFVVGFTTALLYMNPGDRVEVYIPYSLGYGSSASNNIPAYSNLIFDIYVGEVIHPGEIVARVKETQLIKDLSQ